MDSFSWYLTVAPCSRCNTRLSSQHHNGRVGNACFVGTILWLNPRREVGRCIKSLQVGFPHRRLKLAMGVQLLKSPEMEIPGQSLETDVKNRIRSARGPQEDWSKESFVRSIVLSPSFRVSADQRCSNQ